MTGETVAADGRITEQRLLAALRAMRTITGTDVEGAQLIKFTNNAVFRLPACGIVARIAASVTMADRVDKVIRVARWLERGGVPAVRLCDGDQPMVVDGLRVTLWHEVPIGGRRPTGADLARILKLFHRLDPPDGQLSPWAPLGEIRSRLAEPDGVAEADLAYLRDECDRIEEQLSHLSFALPSGPIHGDAFMGNVIDGVKGPVICDFDSSCIGPREWDLVPLAVGKLRFDYPDDDYGALAREYDFDVMRWRGFPILRRLRELKLVTSLVPVLGSREILRPQWQRRLDTYRRGDQAARWTTYVRAA